MDSRFLELAGKAREVFERHQPDRDVVPSNIERAVALGLPALTVPTQFGGLGANLADFAAYQLELAGADGATALVLAMHHMLVGGEAEAASWPTAEWQELCHAAVSRGALVNSAATEPGAGTPSQAGLPGTTATPAGAAPAEPGNAWVLNGRKAYTTGAPFLSFIRVSARVDPPAGDPYGARFLVRLPSPGVGLEDSWHPAALAAAGNQDVILTDAPAEFLYREQGRGCEGTVWFQVAVAATYLGIGVRAHEEVVAFTRGRVTAAGQLVERESVRLRLGASRARLDVARRNLLATCAEWVELAAGGRERMLPDFGLAKVAAVGAATFAAEEAMRLAGAGGLGREHPFPRLLLETRAGLNHPPVDDVAHLVLAERDLA
jgi:alkylation response protein AidB-like acyl-CoA dehydrogenase